MKTKSMNVPKTESTMIKCICNACDSYTKCMESGVMGVFCSTGDAGKCAINVNNCICTDCSVKDEFDLKGQMYCKPGSCNTTMN